jgi:hypothetical protein
LSGNGTEKSGFFSGRYANVDVEAAGLIRKPCERIRVSAFVSDNISTDLTCRWMGKAILVGTRCQKLSRNELSTISVKMLQRPLRITFWDIFQQVTLSIITSNTGIPRQTPVSIGHFVRQGLRAKAANIKTFAPENLPGRPQAWSGLTTSHSSSGYLS